MAGAQTEQQRIMDQVLGPAVRGSGNWFTRGVDTLTGGNAPTAMALLTGKPTEFYETAYHGQGAGGGKVPDQGTVNKQLGPVTDTGGTAWSNLLHGATLNSGLTPWLESTITGVNPDAQGAMQQAMNAENPKSAWAGNIPGLVLGTRGGRAGLNGVGGMLGLAKGAGIMQGVRALGSGLWNVAGKTGAGAVAAASAVGGGLNVVGNALWPEAPREAAPAEPAAAAEADAKPKAPTKQEQIAAIMGVTPEAAASIAAQYGGKIPMALIKQMNAMKGRAPTYREKAFDVLMQIQDAEAAGAVTTEDQAAAIRDLKARMTEILGGQDFGAQFADPNQ